jgi:acyl-CoA synthetase (AMP-forming)/AMP-acid ligase II
MVPLSQKIGTLGCAGQLIPGVRARVVKVDGTLAKAGEPGELVVKTPSLALGYMNNEKAYAAVLSTPFITITYLNAERKRPLLVMGSLVLL